MQYPYIKSQTFITVKAIKKREENNISEVLFITPHANIHKNLNTARTFKFDEKIQVPGSVH